LSWSDEFESPIELPRRKPLVILRDAALYITKLPKAEHDAKKWQAAMQALILVAEHNGPTMFARIGVMKALNRHIERVFNSDRKDHHWASGSWRGIDNGLFTRFGDNVGGLCIMPALYGSRRRFLRSVAAFAYLGASRRALNLLAADLDKVERLPTFVRHL
jgi:hypothetical protein